MAERGSQRSLPPWNAQLLYPILMKSARYYWVADFVNINDSLEIVSITTIVASGISSHRLHSTELVDPEKQLILLPEAVTLAIIIPKSNSVLMQTCGWINSHPHTITNSTFDWFLFSWNSRCLIYHISNNFCPMWPIYVLYIYIYIADFPDSYVLLPSNYYLPIYFKFWPWIQTQCLYVWLYLTLNYMWHFLYILNSGAPFLSKLLGSQSVRYFYSIGQYPFVD